jgi:hypothetical protein
MHRGISGKLNLLPSAGTAAMGSPSSNTDRSETARSSVPCILATFVNEQKNVDRLLQQKASV